MPQRFVFDSVLLTSVVGGRSVVDLPRLAVQTEEQATSFIAAYGFRLEEASDENRLWYFHRRAVVLLEEKLGIKDIPDILKDRKLLGDLRKLLIWASARTSEQKDLQRWSCALLRVMHVFVHAESDLFASFSEEIQKQILTPFQRAVFTEGTTGTTFLRGEQGSDEIALQSFEIKPFKTSSSTVIKLLAKPDALALRVFDKLGVRFITRSMFDSFRVVRFLMDHNLVSFPHIMPDQSSNNLYPTELFCEVCTELSKKKRVWSDDELEKHFQQRLDEKRHEVSWLRKENAFSGDEHQFIKFIARKLVRIDSGGSNTAPFSFFFPYEVQIVDQASFSKVQSGPSEHQQYKERQRAAARKRIFMDAESEPGSSGAPENSEP